MDIVIRTGSMDDYDAILCIGIPVLALHARAVPGRFRVDSDALPADYFRSLIDSMEATVLVAVVDDEVVGFTTLRIEQSPPFPMLLPRRTAFMDLLTVDESRRGQGVGRQLMDAAVVWAREQDAHTLELNVYAFNVAAVEFYERQGLRTIRHTMSLPIHKS